MTVSFEYRSDAVKTVTHRNGRQLHEECRTFRHGLGPESLLTRKAAPLGLDALTQC
jgi:hypothetical protein